MNTNPSKTRHNFFYGYVIVTALFVIQLVMFGSRNSFGVFFKPILSEFGWTRALLSGAFSFSSITQGFTGILMGGLNDKFGPRVVISISAIFMGLGLMLMYFVDSAWQMYFCYAVMIGIGMGGFFAPQMSTVTRWFVKRRNVATAIVQGGAGAGGLIIPPLVNTFISAWDWRISYIIIGSAVLLITIAAAQFLKRDPAKMGLAPLGVKYTGEHLATFQTKGFSLRESAATWQFWVMQSMLLCFGFSTNPIWVHIVPHAIDTGISPAAAANILVVMSGSILIGGLLIAVIADKIGCARSYIISFILMATVLLLLLPLDNVWYFYLLAFTMSMGSGGAATLTSSLAAELFGIKSHGLVLGITSLSYTIGAAAGPVIAGYIFDVNSSYQLAFILCGIANLTGIVLASSLKPVKSLALQ